MTDDQFTALLAELSTTRALVEGTAVRVRSQGEMLDRIEARANSQDEKLDRIEARQERAELRLGSHDEKLDRIEARQERAELRLGSHDEKLDRIEARLERAELRLGSHDEMLERIEARQGEQGDKIDALKRHFDVVTESLEGRIQLVAEGVAAVVEQMERSQRENAKEFAETQMMIPLSCVEPDRRMKSLETSLEVLQSRVTRLENSASI